MWSVSNPALEETVKPASRLSAMSIAIGAILVILVAARFGGAQDTHFHNAPRSSAEQKNPFAGQDDAVKAGAAAYAKTCAQCHGTFGQGTGNIPPINQGATQTVPDGEVFWFITTGSPQNGMPAWASLPEAQRWQIVSYLKTLKNAAANNKAA